MRALARAALAALQVPCVAAGAEVSVSLELVAGTVPFKQRYVRVAKDDQATVRIATGHYRFD